MIKDSSKYSTLSKEYTYLEGLIKLWKDYKSILFNKQEAERIIEEDKDQELKKIAQEELRMWNERLSQKKEEIISYLTRGDENEFQQIIVEIRQGAGGQEAALFAKDLFRMYSKFCELNNLKLEVLDSHPTDIGGFKEIIFSVKGRGSWGMFKYESGVHRVQRVPVTESGGRIHTSTATVAVLEEPQEIELKINPEELKIETFRASGHGGQHVNVTDSAVRITHIPTGIMVSCQDERSQIKNRQKAMRILRARLYNYYKERQEKEMSQLRKSQVGRGQRAEKVRTYNFPENRVTDHRVKLTLYKLDQIMEGKFQEIIDALKKEEFLERLEEISKEEN